ncbi:glycine dehydrogenase, partial [bacterium]|nr:glycine dehydrogenase [bacterium]
QHIRREKATSNICTNQALMALAATVYLASLGEAGLRALAAGLADRAGQLAARIERLPGWRLAFTGDLYQEFVVQGPRPAAEILRAGRARGIAAGIALGEDFPVLGPTSLLVTVSEKHGPAELDRFVAFLAEAGA